MPLQIGSKKIIPAPLVTINKTANFTSDGRHLSSTFDIQLNGTILPNRGSPRSVGWWVGQGEPPDESAFVTDAQKFNSILAKQELIREALKPPGFELSWSPPRTETSPVLSYCQKHQLRPGRMGYEV